MKAPAEMLDEIGYSLFGPYFLASLSNLLGVRDDTVRHWLSGRNKIPLTIFEDLLKVPAIARDDKSRRYLDQWIGQQRRVLDRTSESR